jgi:hypothetical protein
MSFTGTTVRWPGIVNMPVNPTTSLDANGNPIPTVLRGQCVYYVTASGWVAPVIATSTPVFGFALSDADMRQLVVPVWVAGCTVEMLVKTGDVVAQGALLYSAGDGTVTITPSGTIQAVGVAVNPNLGQGTVEMAALAAGFYNYTAVP